MSSYARPLLPLPIRQTLVVPAQLRWCVWYIAACLTGCSAQEDTTSAGRVPPPLTKTTVVAQGQILPAGGIVKLAAAPGDVVDSIADGVKVGGKVAKDQVLATMRSEEVTQLKLETLHRKKTEATREQAVALAAAQRQLATTQLKLNRIELQQRALQRKQEVLDLARLQVSAIEDVLKKLQAISANDVTSEFIGQLEIDRQRISLREAELNYRQQQQLQMQAQEDFEFAKQAALAEQQAAQAGVDALKASQTLEILDLEIRALQEQAKAAQIVAPHAGTVLAINASKGESSLPLPLIEMADLTALICEIEINEIDASRVQAGQQATLHSRAIGRELTGRVHQKFSLVGRPQLRPLDPMARADYRTVMAVVKLDADSIAIASEWLQLQVEVSIDVRSAPSSSNPGPSSMVLPSPDRTFDQ